MLYAKYIHNFEFINVKIFNNLIRIVSNTKSLNFKLDNHNYLYQFHLFYRIRILFVF